MTVPDDAAWAAAEQEHADLIAELAETLDLDAGVADALRRARPDQEAP